MDLQQENRRLHSSVKSLLARIEENQQIQRRFQAFEFRLLAQCRLRETLTTLLEGSREHFGLSDVGLILVDPSYRLAELFEHLDIDHWGNRLQWRHSDSFAQSLYPGEYRVSLGELDTLTAGRLFPNLPQLGSAALLPLVRDGRLLASLNFASESAERFSAEKAVDFMHHLASICAVCLDNALTHEYLFFQSQQDMLTQVSNRQHFDSEFTRELERAQRSGEPLSCLFVDLDEFKQINDEHGHQAGDLCLKQVAGAIRQQLRKTDLVARYGGEEFVLLLPCCPQDQAMTIADRIRLAVAALEVDGKGSIYPTVSIGLVCWQPLTERPGDLERLGQRLLKCADDAMYEAKRTGRNRVVNRGFYQLVQG